MAVMAITVALLFAVGFGGGYFARASMSWIRRSKLKKQRAERDVDERQAESEASVAAVNVRPINA
jgi:uncharacterized membrane protein YciS (DUF1049 family)